VQISALKKQINIGLDVSALDPSFKAHQNRGIGRYVSALASHLPKALAEYLEDPKPQRISVGDFNYLDLRCPAQLDRFIDFIPYGQQTIRQQLIYPFRIATAKTKDFDLLHFPAHMDPPGWSPKPYVVTVLDLIPLVLKDLYASENDAFASDWRFRLARWLELRAIRGAKRIIAISEQTANDIVGILGIPRERIDVTPLGIDDFFFNSTQPTDRAALAAKLNLKSDSIVCVYVGGIDPRKNILTLVEIFKGLGDASPDLKSRLRLVIAGKIEGDRNYGQLLKDIDRLGLNSSISLAGYLTDNELLCLYHLGKLFIFPSLYEGFGLPPLEAFAAGLPVVCAKTSSLPEVLGDNALWFDPHSAYEGVVKALEIIRNSDLAEKMAIDGRERARKFTWENTAKLTIKAYSNLFIDNF
jgi:glycosyltransferase involved in cell wall biosynthesis